jgi:serine/threonine protein kinase
MLLCSNESIMPVVKIADFGACVFMDGHGEKVPFQGTVHFMAPELFLSANQNDIDFTRDAKIDVFALGASLYFMLVGRPPWSGKSELELATQIKNIELTFPPSEKYEPSLKVWLCTIYLAVFVLPLLYGHNSLCYSMLTGALVLLCMFVNLGSRNA